MPLEEAVLAVMEQRGVTACALVDIESGQCLARAGVTVAGVLETSGLVNARLLRTKMRFAYDQHHETIEDVLITLDHHYHMIRLINGGEPLATMFFYVMLDREVANLALARRKVAEVERSLTGSEEKVVLLETARRRALGAELEGNKVHGSREAFPENDELLPFMRDDVAMKLLGIERES